MCTHFQGFRILRQSQFPPHPSHDLLENSLNSNWFPGLHIMACPWGFVIEKEAPFQENWNASFDFHHCLLCYTDPCYKTQHCLQRLIKASRTQDQLDSIYEIFVERPKWQRNWRAREEGQQCHKIQRYSLELLHKTLVPESWPLLGFEYYSSIQDFAYPYVNFLGCNSYSSNVYFPYISYNNLDICIQRGFLTDNTISNLHYFVETYFMLHKKQASLLISKKHWDSPIQSWLTKENRKNLWLSKNGTGKWKNRLLYISPGLIGTTTTSTTSSFSLLSYLVETFVDNFFSDLL